MPENVFTGLQHICSKPVAHSIYNASCFDAATFWNDHYISKQLLRLHLNPEIDLCSRRKEAISSEVSWINKHMNISANTRICDFGCGPGLYTTEWAKEGAQVTGIDISEQSIFFAKQQAEREGIQVEYVCQNFLEYSSTKKFDLITMIFYVYNDLDSKQRAHLLRKFYTLLDDDGAILLDVSSLSKFAEKNEKEVSFASASFPSTWLNFWSPEYHYLFTSCFKYDAECLTLDKYTVVESGRIREVFIWIQYYTLQSLRAEFEANGFEIVEHYADFSGKEYQLDSPGIAVIAKKSKIKNIDPKAPLN